MIDRAAGLRCLAAASTALAMAFDGLAGFFDPGDEYVQRRRFGPAVGQEFVDSVHVARRRRSTLVRTARWRPLQRGGWLFGGWRFGGWGYIGPLETILVSQEQQPTET